MMASIGKFFACICAAALIATVSLGAAPASAADKATLRLDWVNSGYHAIWYYGLDKGIFQKAGIDLEVLEGKGSAVTAQTVGNGSVTFGTADTAAVMGFIAQGMPIKIVAGYLRQSALATTATVTVNTAVPPTFVDAAALIVVVVKRPETAIAELTADVRLGLLAVSA